MKYKRSVTAKKAKSIMKKLRDKSNTADKGTGKGKAVFLLKKKHRFQNKNRSVDLSSPIFKKRAEESKAQGAGSPGKHDMLGLHGTGESPGGDTDILSSFKEKAESWMSDLKKRFSPTNRK